MRTNLHSRTLATLSAACCAFAVIDFAIAAEPVTVDNFVRAESDLYIGNTAMAGGLGKLQHRRSVAALGGGVPRGCRVGCHQKPPH